MNFPYIGDLYSSGCLDGLMVPLIIRKPLAPNEKQLSAETPTKCCCFQVEATGRLLNFFWKDWETGKFWQRAFRISRGIRTHRGFRRNQ